METLEFVNGNIGVLVISDYHKNAILSVAPQSSCSSDMQHIYILF